MTHRPDLFIVGAPKSGTTSLYEYLSGHPAVYMSPVKEPMYFCPDVRPYRGRQPFVYGEDEEGYLALFDGADEAQRRGEATTRYLVSREAPALVKDFAPAARAVALLRNPVDLIQALHNERVSQGHEPLTDLAAALDADDDRANGMRLPGEANALGAVYRESGLFAEAVDRWFAALGRSRVHVIVFDDFAANPARELRSVLEFLEVTPDYHPPAFKRHNERHRQRGSVRRVVDSRLGSFLSDDVARTVLGQQARSRLALRFRQSRINRRTVARSPVPAELRRRLADEFRGDVVATGALIGRDLASEWLGGRS